MAAAASFATLRQIASASAEATAELIAPMFWRQPDCPTSAPRSVALEPTCCCLVPQPHQWQMRIRRCRSRTISPFAPLPSVRHLSLWHLSLVLQSYFVASSLLPIDLAARNHWPDAGQAVRILSRFVRLAADKGERFVVMVSWRARGLAFQLLDGLGGGSICNRLDAHADLYGTRGLDANVENSLSGLRLLRLRLPCIETISVLGLSWPITEGIPTGVG
eukprot:scaffold36637_cov30-Tisochrysis_lutea.AAC.3